MIFATFPRNLDTASIECEVVDGVEQSRTIRGTAVPWNVVGTVSDGRKVRFHPGSLPADATPIVTLGHEGPAIGVARENSDDGAGMRTVVKASRVPDGDNALVLAADGVLGMFSVGAEPTEFGFDAEGVMDIHAADWQHLALLPFGAFTDARVDSVAAAQGDSNMPEAVTTEAPPPEVEAAQPNPSLPATIPMSAARPTQQPLTLQRYASLIAQVNRGELTADALRATVQAALTNVTSTNVGAIAQPAYRAEITAIVDHGTPLLQALNSSPLPASGMSIEYPEWVSKPTVGVQATEKSAITSTAATMTLKSAAVETIAGGNDLSLQSVERSSPSFLEAYLRAAAVDFSRKAEGGAITKLLAAATAATPGANFLANVQALFAALDPATTPPGPMFLALGYSVALPLISTTVNNGPAFWNGQIDFGSMTPALASGEMPFMFVDWNLPTDHMWLGSRAGATWHQQGPADVRVVDVSLLGVDVGVYGYTCLTIEYPASFAKLDTVP